MSANKLNGCLVEMRILRLSTFVQGEKNPLFQKLQGAKSATIIVASLYTSYVLFEKGKLDMTKSG